MDNSTTNDENSSSLGKKRQQPESPFSAATPNSRIGKESKRFFGSEMANAADENLEQTCIESDSSSTSFASEMTPEEAVRTPTAPSLILSQINKDKNESCLSSTCESAKVNCSIHHTLSAAEKLEFELSEQNNLQEKIRQDFESQMEQLQEQHRQELEEAVKVSQKKIRDLEEELISARQQSSEQFSDLQNQKSAIESELEALQSKQAEELINASKAMQQKILKLEDQLSDCLERESKKTLKTSLLEAELKDYVKKHREQLKTLLDQRDFDSDQTSSVINGLEEQLATARQQQSEHFEKMGRLESKLEENSQLKKELEKTCQKKDEVVADLENQKRQQSEELAQLHKELADARNECQILETFHTSLSDLKKELNEKETQLTALQSEVAELNKKLRADELVMLEKENLVIRLESRLEFLNRQLSENECWKTQAMSVETLSKAMISMQSQLKDLSAKLETSNRKVVEHDVTLMKEEVDERSTELEKARVLIDKLQNELKRSERKIERLEKVCDEFDDTEIELNEKCRSLEAQLKALKGVKSSTQEMGLLQKARLGIKPMSRESSISEHREKKTSEVTAQKTLESTRIHPDDDANESVLGTPSSKKNRSNCQQQ